MKTTIITICLLTIVGLTASYFSIQDSETYKNCVAEHRAKQITPNSEKTAGFIFVCEAQFISRRSEVVTAIATVYIGLFSLVLSIATILLWEETRDSAKVSKATLVLTQRPRMVARLFEVIRRESEQNHIVGVRFEVANIGGTKAQIISTGTHVDIKKISGVPKYTPDSIKFDNEFFLPGEREVVTINAPEENFSTFATDSWLKDLAESRLVIYGFIDYRDDFGNIRRTAFGWSYDPRSKDFSKIENPSYSYED